jgi:uncharacterized membrane protein (DUF2068 family)
LFSIAFAEQEKIGERRSLMSQRANHEAAMLHEARSVRYLKLIALFKIVKAVLLVVLGVSLLSLDTWGGWVNAPLKWIANEILLQHSKAVSYLLRNLQAVLSGGARHATAFLSLFYAALFFTEGIGVYLQQRWAALLIIFEGAAFIPIELHHLWHRPGLVPALILLANCLIVWFLYILLKRDSRKTQVAVGRDGSISL